MSTDVLEERQVYRCENPACSLGSRSEPGHFTGGATAVGINILTGTPEEHLTEGLHYGEGVCPNCGELGKPETTPADLPHEPRAKAKGGGGDA